jgi:hypothetical protein
LAEWSSNLGLMNPELTELGLTRLGLTRLGLTKPGFAKLAWTRGHGCLLLDLWYFDF